MNNKITSNTTYTTPTNYVKINLCEMILKSPHCLIGGTTGSGKSVLIDDLIYTIITHNTPHQARILLIDPKRVTFEKYKHLPHVEQIQTENDAIIKLLNDVVFTMENRYKRMREKGLLNYDGTKLYVIIDEIADLMDTAGKRVLPLIQRIAQLGRASEIHLICATQRPSRKTIPAEMVNNFTSRVALRCLNAIESRQLINTKGAETLPQYGKAIYLHCDGQYHNFEIPYLPDIIQERINFWLKQGNNDAYFKQTLPDEKTTAKKTRYTLFDILNGNRLLRLEKKKPKKADLTDLDFLNILSIIDDD